MSSDPIKSAHSVFAEHQRRMEARHPVELSREAIFAKAIAEGKNPGAVYLSSLGASKGGKAKPEIEQQLRRVIDGNLYPMISLTEICRTKIGHNEVVVRQYFPKLAMKISRRYLENRKLRARQERARFCAEIHETARALHEQGQVPNHKTLSPYISKPTNLRCSHAIKALQEIRVTLGYQCVDLLHVG